MKIESIHLMQLRNEEHYQFQNDFKGLVEKHTPAALGIAAPFAAYLPLFANENEARDVILRSTVTNDLVDADALRDRTFRGMAGTVKAACHHFNDDVRAAAIRLQVVFGHYGNLAEKPYDEETAAISSMVQDLKTAHSVDAGIVGINNWISELESNNLAFDALKKERYAGQAAITVLKMNQVRAEIDKAYRTLVELINALTVLNGPDAYSSFVSELNVRIEAYNQMLALRKGRGAKDTETVKTTPDA